MIATMTAYNQCDDYIDQLNDYIKENMKYVKEYLNLHHPQIHFEIPDATYLAWIDITELPYSARQVQDALVKVGKVAIMQGETYGMDKYLRLNCGCPREKLIEG